MENEKEKINKLSLPVAILIATIILGGFYFIKQVIIINIEEQRNEKQIQRLEECLDNARTSASKSFNEIISLNGEEKIINNLLEIIEKKFQEDRSDCFKKYPQK